MDKGYTYRQAKKIADKRTTHPNKSTLKVAYGTRTDKFYFILPEDRDYYSNFAMDLYNFNRTKSHKEAKKLLT